MSLTFPVDAKLKDGSPVQLVRLMSGMSSRSDSSTGDEIISVHFARVE